MNDKTNELKQEKRQTNEQFNNRKDNALFQTQSSRTVANVLVKNDASVHFTWSAIKGAWNDLDREKS